MKISYYEELIKINSKQLMDMYICFHKLSQVVSQVLTIADKLEYANQKTFANLK